MPYDDVTDHRHTAKAVCLLTSPCQLVSMRGWGRWCLVLRFQVMPARWWRHSSQTTSNRRCSLTINQPLYSLQPASVRGWDRCCLVLRFQVMPVRWWRHSSQTASNRSWSLAINQPLYSLQPASVRGWGRCLVLRFQVMPVRWWRHGSLKLATAAVV